VTTPAFVFPDNAAALAATRELGNAGVPVTLITSRDGPASLSRFARVERAPDFYEAPTAWCAYVTELARRSPEPPVLIPTEDAALLVAESFHHELSQVARYPYPAPGVLPRVLDKLELYAAAERMGIGVPRSYEVTHETTSVPSDDGWIVKPSCRYHFDRVRGVTTLLSMTGGSKAFGGSVAGAAERVRDAGFRCMVQELVPGRFEELVSVGLCLDRDGRLISSFSTRKRCEYPEPFGDGLVVETIDDPGILEPSVALLRQLGYWGICDVEYKRDARDGRMKLLDANPRVWLWVGLASDAGSSPLALTAYRLALGDGRIPERFARSGTGASAASGRPGLTWVSPRGAAAFLLKQYRPAKHGIGLLGGLTVGALRTMLRSLRAFRDPLYARPSTWPRLLQAAASARDRTNRT
jgi:predicted ATP-grasp superfamily ATP-dependent carboligase